MKIKPIKQKNSLACGPTCIFLADRYLGGNTSFTKIERLTQYKKRQGVDDVDIVKTLKNLGYKTNRILNCTWENLKKYNTKDTILIVSWMLNGYKGHVSIVDKIVKDTIYLIDSEAGKIIKIRKIQFMRLWLEYDGHWWPRILRDIHLRPVIIVKKS